MLKICLLSAKRLALRDYLSSRSVGKVDFATQDY